MLHVLLIYIYHQDYALMQGGYESRQHVAPATGAAASAVDKPLDPTSAALLRAMPEATIIVDDRGRLVVLNAQIERLLGPAYAAYELNLTTGRDAPATTATRPPCRVPCALRCRSAHHHNGTWWATNCDTSRALSSACASFVACRRAATRGGPPRSTAARVSEPGAERAGRHAQWRYAHGAHPAGPTVAIMKIEDTGIGIPLHNRAHVFEPFWTNKPNGTGLGLSTCPHIVAQHDRQIDIDSTPDTGLTFRVVVPHHRHTYQEDDR